MNMWWIIFLQVKIFVNILEICDFYQKSIRNEWNDVKKYVQEAWKETDQIRSDNIKSKNCKWMVAFTQRCFSIGWTNNYITCWYNFYHYLRNSLSSCYIFHVAEQIYFYLSVAETKHNSSYFYKQILLLIFISKTRG